MANARVSGERQAVLDIVGDNAELRFLEPAEDYDYCIVGVAERCGIEPAVAYDVDAVFNRLFDNGLSEEEAQEHFNNNLLGGYMGDNSPIFITLI